MSSMSFSSTMHPPMPSPMECNNLIHSVRSSNPATLGPLRDVCASVYYDLLSEVILDCILTQHKLTHARWSQPQANADLFGLGVDKKQKKEPERTFKCESCGKKSGSSKYAAHLEKCTGKGGRASARRGKTTTTTTTGTTNTQQQAPVYMQDDVPNPSSWPSSYPPLLANMEYQM